MATESDALAQGGAATQPLELSVDMDRVIQPNFLGVNGTYHGFAFMPEQVNKGMGDADRTREFDRVARMGLNIARTWYRPDWACGDKLANDFNWDTPKMKAFGRWLEAMKERKVDVALQAAWWFPGDTYFGKPAADASADPQRFAEWVSQSLHQLIEVKGFTNIKYVILFTEPTTTSLGNLPNGEDKWVYYVKVVKAIHDRLSADGRRKLVKLVGPNNTSGGTHLAEAARDLRDQIDILSGHSYNLAGYGEWLRLCQGMQAAATKVGKDCWLDEYGKQDEKYRQTGDYGTYIAQVVAASINAGNQSSIIWLLFDQQYVGTNGGDVQTWTSGDSFYNGVHRWGLCKWPHDTIANPTFPYPHWYAFSMLSRYLGGGPGTRAMATTSAGGVYLAAINSPKNDWSLLVINGSADRREVTVKFSSPLKRTLYRYLYDPAAIAPNERAELIGHTVSPEFPDIGDKLADILPARAVAVYSTIGK